MVELFSEEVLTFNFYAQYKYEHFHGCFFLSFFGRIDYDFFMNILWKPKPGTANRKLERLQFSTSSSFFKIRSACSGEFKVYFWTFWAWYTAGWNVWGDWVLAVYHHNHKNWVPSILIHNLWLIFIRMKQKKIFFWKIKFKMANSQKGHFSKSPIWPWGCPT